MKQVKSMTQAERGKHLPSRKGDPNWKPRTLSNLDKNHAMPRVARPIPKEIEEQNLLVNQMYQWVLDNPNEISLDMFAVCEGFRPYKLYKLRHSNKYFADVFYMCWSLIIDRMSDEIWKGRGNHLIWFNTKKCWDETYREMINEEIAMRVRAKEASENVVTTFKIVEIQMDAIPDTPEITKSLQEKRGIKRDALPLNQEQDSSS